MLLITIARRYSLMLLIAAALASTGFGQGAKRIVIVKLDGVPVQFVDKFVREQDPKTGRSMLPWFEEVFYKNGTRVPNFYSRGMSLSGPAWGQIDTGQHLQIKGNVEYDRYTLRTYDYLGLIPFYTRAALKQQVDTPAVQVLDELHVPLLQDMFPYERQYTANQLYQRGVSWEVIGGGFMNVFPRGMRDIVDEWTMGFDFRDATVEQNERDIIGKIKKRPDIDYYDYYNGGFDHASHHNSDNATRLVALKKIDSAIGRIWTAIQQSTRADQTAFVVVSDHGFNSEPGVISQGFSLVRLLASPAGGGHHIVTKRRLMLDYSIKGLNPYVPTIKTQSKDSFYLKGQNEDYPTVLLDFDGNERSSLHFRNSRVNVLHILLQQLKSGKLAAPLKRAVRDAFFDEIDAHRAEWQRTADELGEELAVLHKLNEAQQKVVDALPKKSTPDDVVSGDDKAARRLQANLGVGLYEEQTYTTYVDTLRRLLELKRDSFDAAKVKIEDVIQPRAMGDPNSVYDLQNYVVGLAPSGLVLDASGRLDMDRTFTTVNYFDLLERQRVLNTVQPKLGNEPIDFVAVRIPKDAIWLYGGVDKQALIFSRSEADGSRSYKYLPVASLQQDKDGKVVYQTRELSDGFPLKMFEDANFGVPVGERSRWVSTWHPELEWLRTAHRSVYSNAVIALDEQLNRHEMDEGKLEGDDAVLKRFRERQRHLTEADLLVMANNHWNFDVRGFNPGGNHGSFFRVSTNSTLMFAGGSATGIPKGLAVDEPYDSLSVMPTILALMGKIDSQNEPDDALKKLGYRRFPGRVVKEVLAR